MLNRAERRRRNKVIYNRRVKLFYQLGWGRNIKVSEDEAFPNDKRYAGTQTAGDTHWHKAESWKEAKERSNSLHLYKNTGTIWSRGYWNKYDRHRLNKQSRRNAKLDLLNGEEIAYERTNLK